MQTNQSLKAHKSSKTTNVTLMHLVDTFIQGNLHLLLHSYIFSLHVKGEILKLEKEKR